MENNEYFESNNRFKRKLEMPKIETKPDWKSTADDLAECLEEIIRLSDRGHIAWKLGREALDNYKKLTENGKDI